MVGVLISMKLRVLRHSLGGIRGAFFGIGAVIGLAVAAGCAVFLALHPGGLTVGTDLASALIAVWTLGWLFGPILAGGGDETLRPENFALLPIRPVPLAVGLFGASLAGVAPLVTLIVFAGLVCVAVPVGTGAVVVAVLAVALQLAMAVLLSKVVIAGLGALLGSRRGKDLGVLLTALAALAYWPASYAFQTLGPIVLGQSSPVFSAALRYLPTGWGPTAVAASAAQDWLAALGWLLALAVVDGLLVLAWSRLLVRRLTTSQSASQPGRSARTGPARRRLRLLPESPLGAVIGKELRTWWRDARRRAMLLSSILIGAIVPVMSTVGNANASTLAFGALWIVFFAAMQVGNLYGFDGSALWQTLVTPGAVNADVRGRQWAWLLIVGPIALLAAAILPAVAGAPGAYPWVLALMPALLGGGAGTVLLMSVFAPFPMPTQRGRNPFSSGGRAGFSGFLPRMGIIFLQLATAVPAFVLLLLGALDVLPWANWAAVPVGVLSGLVAAWWWGGIACRRLARRGPELLAAVRVAV
ncbi:MAG TPA: hypothetical protein VK735_17170 [Pseudonocardia sp.]|uniref:hypothetical protein n=1 Tax=Pseudonocardia sp. TaxID=60912 RepID=UPI002CE00A2B|nr:hypothetical protein [Pseudonocardia sp.]HTF49175.1 hypothetical protein [Pseudonocardia sp.]